MAIVTDAIARKYVGGTLQVEDLMWCFGYRRLTIVVLIKAYVEDDKLILEFEPGKALNTEDRQYLGESDCRFEVSVFNIEMPEDGSLRANIFLAQEKITIVPPSGVDIKSIIQPNVVLATA
jgi:hypothetical protein